MNQVKISDKLLFFIIETIKTQWFKFLAIIFFPCALVIDQIIFPYCIKIIIDTIGNFQGEKSNIYEYLMPALQLGAGTWVFLIFIWRFLDLIDAHFIPKFQASIRLKVFERVENHSYKYFSEEFSGGIANKISDLADGSWRIIYFIFREFTPATMSIFFTIIILGKLHLEFSLITLVFYISHMLICILTANKFNGLSAIHANTRSELQGNIVDSLTNITHIRLFNRGKYELNFIKKYQDIESTAHKDLLYNLFIVRFILDLPALVMIGFTTYYLINGWQTGIISLGDFTFILTVALNNIVSIWRVGGALPDFFKDIGTSREALAIVEDPYSVKDEAGAQDIKINKGEIVFENVTFSHIKNQALFSNLNVKIKAGEKLGLVGFSGSGKSTFINLIVRHFNPEYGNILIDGQNIASISQNSLRQVIAVVQQDTTLFNRSIFYNIQFGKLGATEDEVKAASLKANCHEFISKFEQGYDHIVGERGTKLSGGQRQRISIARAILKNAPILILDEATSALDTVSEKYIQGSLNSLMSGKTSIIIAHRLSTLVGLDRILVFHNGKIIEDGNHTELLAQHGHYARLWNMQLDGFLPIKA